MPNNVNWTEAYNRLFTIINTKIGEDNAPYYITGPKFINIIKVVDFSLPTRSDVYMKERADKGLPSSREIWFKELLDGLPEVKRFEAYKTIIDGIEALNPPGLDELKKILGLGAGETDTHAGVFVKYQSVGSVCLPGALGSSAGLGRTLTHEAGHFFKNGQGVCLGALGALCRPDHLDKLRPPTSRSWGTPRRRGHDTGH
ncbi:MAG: hypothetical protein EOP45_22010 [Sphingobacteriaceae bacterium]|nr:MAG: hypothetical protein EOP45_22010 [Sphingobacteriaceae bacterium]